MQTPYGGERCPKGIEGYWAPSWLESFIPSSWPWPKEHDQPFEGEADFIKKLRQIEEQLKKAPIGHYDENDGYSICRICNSENGSGEYHLDKYSWPEGYRHYIEKHHVIPSKQFYSFIKGLPEKENEPKQEYLTGSKDWFF